ncbi:MAG: hypothetical protein M1819_005335 [Sarea resinae]|nr:MAG: hypothetical protein M1819_005335 [Sarea resinae]
MATVATSNGVVPKITLYTNHACPWAHRAHIALKELDLPYEEVIIDLNRPRDEWYLKINPFKSSPSASPQFKRGLVPTIKYSNGILSDEIITESGIVAQFLADARPSHLLPPSYESPTAPLFRARVNFFVDAYISKVLPLWFGALRSEGAEEKSEKIQVIVDAVAKEIEPLLKVKTEGQGPYFLGSEKLTLAEVQTAPFIIRLYTFANDDFLPASLKTELETRVPHFSAWAKKVIAQESVTYVFDAESITKHTKARFEKLKQEGK